MHLYKLFSLIKSILPITVSAQRWNKWLKTEKPNQFDYLPSCTMQSQSKKKFFSCWFHLFFIFALSSTEIEIAFRDGKICTVHGTTNKRPFEHICEKCRHMVGSYQTLPSAETVQFTRSGWPATTRVSAPILRITAG